MLKLCPFGAIEVNDGKVAINAGCRMCRICIKKGPAGAFELIENDAPAADKSKWRGIAVVAEVTAGKLHPVSFELLGKARELAERKTEQIGSGSPTLNVYEFDENSLCDTGLSVLRFQNYSKEWAEFILMNRRNRTRIPAHNYDIVIGPIADDAVGFQIRRFTSGLINMDMFVEELKYMKGITIQYFFGTEKAIRYLKKLETL